MNDAAVKQTSKFHCHYFPRRFHTSINRRRCCKDKHSLVRVACHGLFLSAEYVTYIYTFGLSQMTSGGFKRGQGAVSPSGKAPLPGISQFCRGAVMCTTVPDDG